MIEKNGFLPLGQDIQVPFHKAGIMNRTSYLRKKNAKKLAEHHIFSAMKWG
jgi:hypothetical protein